MIKKNIKLIIGFVIGLFLVTGVYAVNTLNASSISIDKTNMNKVPESNLQSALDYLYSKSKTNNMITIESGVLHEVQTYLGIVYLDPTNLDTKCTAQNSVSTTGTKTGCMKWYIYKDLGDSYKMILDHNTTAKLNTSERTGWNKDNINVSYEESNAYVEIQDLSKTVENGGSGWVVEPDIISAEEVAEIVGKTGYTNTSGWFCLDSLQPDNTNYCAKREGTSNYAWLFNNTNNCTSYGCNIADSSNNGYWTKTTRGAAGSGLGVWYVYGRGYLVYHDATYANIGLRPVITISKSLFN